MPGFFGFDGDEESYDELNRLLSGALDEADDQEEAFTDYMVSAVSQGYSIEDALNTIYESEHVGKYRRDRKHAFQ